MNNEFQSLLRKEWTENRKLLWIGIVYVVGFLGYAVAYEIEYRTRAFIAGVYHTCMVYGQLGAVLLAMHTSTAEYTQRTLKFSASLPISLTRVAWARLLGAWWCLVVPMLIGTILATLLLATGFIEQAGLRSDVFRLPRRPSISQFESIGLLWTTTAIAIAYALQLSTAISFLGTRCRSEGTVGLLGAIVILFSMFATDIRPMLDRIQMFALSDWIGSLLPNSLLISYGYGDIDGSHYTDLDIGPLIAGPLIVNFLITLGMATWFTRCYGSRLHSSDRATSRWRQWLRIPIMPNVGKWLPKWYREQLASLIWLNARQSIPLSLAGLVIAVLITLVSLMEDRDTGSSFERIRANLPHSTWIVGMLWGAIVAVGVFGSELKPGLEHFWRSRPIAPRDWFWIKYVVGLVAVVGALDIIPALISWNSTYQPSSGGRMGLVYLACTPFLHALIYAIAVAGICQLRRTVPAAIFALLFFYIIDAVLKSIPFHTGLSTMDVFNQMEAAQRAGEPLDLTSTGYPIVYGGVLAIIVLATILARRQIIPPRSASLSLLAALSIGLCWPNDARGDEPPDTSEILDGIRKREAIIHDVHLRLKWQRHRTDLFFANEAASSNEGRPRRRLRTTQPPPPRDEEAIYELFERLPCRAWIEFGPDGAVRQKSAFDGALERQHWIDRGDFDGRITELNRARPLPFPTPELFEGLGIGVSLEFVKVGTISRRIVEGEQLIDIILPSPKIDVNDTGQPVPGMNLSATINASRDYWPVSMKVEHITTPGTVVSVVEVKSTGWIDAGPIVYPRRWEKTTYFPMPVVDASQKSDDGSIGKTKLEAFEIQEVEVLEAAVNSGLTDDVFHLSFPPGMILADDRDKSHDWYESDASGNVRPYQPKPKGIRGAVFAYHLIWSSIATGWLFLRKQQQ